MKILRTLRLLALGVLVFLALAGDDAGARRRGQRRQDNSPKIGDKAPDFDLLTLESLLGKSKAPKKVRLSSFRGKKPVVFVLSSYT